MKEIIEVIYLPTFFIGFLRYIK